MSITNSLFVEYVDKYFAPVIKSYVEKWNEKKQKENYLVPSMTRNEFSADLTFSSASLNHSIVAADVVSLSSPLPLKSRGSISKVTGIIPKVGLKYSLNEKEIQDLLIMAQTGVKEGEIVKKLMDDATKCIEGVDMRNEILFQQALSEGVILVDEDTNTGEAIRVDFGYKDDHMFKVAAAWGQSGYTPQSDVQKMFTKADADGNTIAILMMSRKYFDLFRNSDEGKLMSANFRQLTYTAATKLPTPTRSQMIDAMKDEYGCDIKIVDTSVKVEVGGTTKSFKPWKEDAIVGIPSERVGRVVYGTLVEEKRPVNGVNYQKAGDFTLVSKFAHNEPLEEFTAGQALCIPVIDDVDQIYVLNASEVTE